MVEFIQEIVVLRILSACLLAALPRNPLHVPLFHLDSYGLVVHVRKLWDKQVLTRQSCAQRPCRTGMGVYIAVRLISDRFSPDLALIELDRDIRLVTQSPVQSRLAK